MNRILKFYTQEEFDAFVKFFSFAGANAEFLAQKFLTKSIDKVGAFYAISNPCKVEDAIPAGTNWRRSEDYEPDDSMLIKQMKQDKIYGFIQIDGIWGGKKFTAYDGSTRLINFLRFYADTEASGGYFWKKGEHPKSLKLGINDEGIYAQSIAF